MTSGTRRGLTLLEVVVVTAMLALVFAVLAPQLIAGDRFAAEEQVRVTLSSTLDAQLLILERDGSFTTSLETLGRANPRVTHVQAAPSTGPRTASFDVDGDELGVAVRDGAGSCWVARTDGVVTLYGVRDGGGQCTAALAFTVEVDPDDPGRGRSLREPVTLP
jgi:prepilin-type N-terminal cleavage/methylation domain-containing protein